MEIATPSALLRGWRAEDAESLARHADDPGIAAMMRDEFPSPYTPQEAFRFIAAALCSPTDLVFAIEVDEDVAGGIGINPFKDIYRRGAEIGYWLAEPFRGRGIATDAVRALVPVAFKELDIVRLQAGVFSNNLASMRVLERCGFVREAVRVNAIWKLGRLFDEVLYVRFGP